MSYPNRYMVYKGREWMMRVTWNLDHFAVATAPKLADGTYSFCREGAPKRTPKPVSEAALEMLQGFVDGLSYKPHEFDRERIANYLAALSRA